MTAEIECPLCGVPMWDDEEMCVTCVQTLIEEEVKDNGPKNQAYDRQMASTDHMHHQRGRLGHVPD